MCRFFILCFFVKKLSTFWRRCSYVSGPIIFFSGASELKSLSSEDNSFELSLRLANLLFLAIPFPPRLLILGVLSAWLVELPLLLTEFLRELDRELNPFARSLLEANFTELLNEDMAYLVELAFSALIEMCFWFFMTEKLLCFGNLVALEAGPPLDDALVVPSGPLLAAFVD